MKYHAQVLKYSTIQLIMLCSLESELDEFYYLVQCTLLYKCMLYI